MSRVPSLDPERSRLIAKLRRDLEHFLRIPAGRREAECANEGEQTCRGLLADLGVVGFEGAHAERQIEVIGLDEFLERER